MFSYNQKDFDVHNENIGKKIRSSSKIKLYYRRVKAWIELPELFIIRSVRPRVN